MKVVADAKCGKCGRTAPIAGGPLVPFILEATKPRRAERWEFYPNDVKVTAHGTCASCLDRGIVAELSAGEPQDGPPLPADIENARIEREDAREDQRAWDRFAAAALAPTVAADIADALMVERARRAIERAREDLMLRPSARRAVRP